MRLGEALIASGHLTQFQLDTALNAQLIYGGHLGTCLIELGYVDEQTLGNLLSRVYNVKYANPGMLDDIQPHVLAALNQTTVEKHMVIPFDQVKKTLHVAMVNPTHVPSLDELSFVSGLRIEACVSPEVRIFQAMERYYQVPRRVRYIALARNLDDRKQKAPARKKGAAAAAQIAMAAQGGSGLQVEMAVQGAPATRVAMAAVGAPAAQVATGAQSAPAARVEVAAQAAVAGAGTAMPLPRLVALEQPAESDHYEGREDRNAQDAPTAAPRAFGSSGLEERLRRTAEDLCRLEASGPAIKVLLDHAARDARRCVLFGVKNTEAFIRDVRGFPLDALSAHKVRFDVTTEPLLALLAGEPFYRGPAPSESRNQRFFDAMHIPTPREIVLIPVHQHDHLAALLYADGGADACIEGETESFIRAIRKFTLSLDLIDLKHRIRSA